MVKIVACYSMYNSISTILSSIDSCRSLVDHFIFVDGVVPEILQGRRCSINQRKMLPYSTDGTLEICKQNGEVVECTVPWSTEVGKRNEYFNRIEDGDWAFIIDSDETLEVDDIASLRQRVLNETAPSIDVYSVTIPSVVKRKRMIRFYKVQNGVHYCGNHASVFDGRHRDITSMAPLYNDVKIVNNKEEEYNLRKSEMKNGYY